MGAMPCYGRMALVGDLGRGGMAPSAALLLLAAVSGFGAAWGWQLILAVEAIPGVQAHPAGYWFVYSLLTALGASAVAWLGHLCRMGIGSALNRKPTRRVETSEFVREYLLLRDARNRNRENTGWGGPCPSPRWKAYMAQQAR